MTLFATEMPKKVRLHLRDAVGRLTTEWELNRVRSPRPLPIWTPDVAGLDGENGLQYHSAGWRCLLAQDSKLGWIDLQKPQLGLGIPQLGGQQQTEQLLAKLVDLERSEWAACDKQYEVRIISIRYLHLSAIWLFGQGEVESNLVFPMLSNESGPVALADWDTIVGKAAAKKKIDPAKRYRVGA